MADITVDPTLVLKSASASVNYGGVAGATITQGQVLYIDTANSSVMKLADANAGSAGDLIRQGLQISLNAASTGQPVAYVTLDTALNIGATLTSGAAVYLSDTPGAMTALYSDIASGATVVILGVANTGGTLNFNPLVGGTK